MRRSLQWKRFLGAGEDGFAISAELGDTMAAFKFFHHTKRRRPIGRLRRYWPLKRECANASLLSMIKSSVQNAAATEEPIYLNPEPKTLHDATRNLEAFASDSELGERSRPDGWTPVDLDVQINDCLGWLSMPRADVHAAIRRSKKKREPILFPEISLAYQAMDESETLVVTTVQRQLDFLHVAGFVTVPLNQDNWRGDGVLVDHCDLVSPYGGTWWNPRRYARMSVARDFEMIREYGW